MYKNSHESNIVSKIEISDAKSIDIGINFLISSRKLYSKSALLTILLVVTGNASVWDGYSSSNLFTCV